MLCGGHHSCPSSSFCNLSALYAQGYVAVWSQNDTSMSCEPVGTPYPPAWLKAMALTLTIVGIPTVSTLGALFWYKTRVQLRRRWQRERELMKHRAKGVPSGGPATIVVTDVEGYSGGLLHSHAHCVPDNVQALYVSCVVAESNY